MALSGGLTITDDSRVLLSPIEIDVDGPVEALDLTEPQVRQYLYVYAGKGQAELDGWVTSFEAGDILSVPSRAICRLTLEPGSKLFRFGVSDAFLISRVGPALAITMSDYMAQFNEPRKMAHWVGEADANERQRLWKELNLAARRLGPTGDTVVAAYVMLLLFERNKPTGAVSEAGLDEEPAAASVLTMAARRDGPVGVVVRLRKLIDQHFHEGWRTQDYACALDIRLPELVSACKEVLGCTPAALIHERVLLDARRRLSYSTASAARIADELGFSDAAYFSRFFKRHTGMSPGQFRRALTAQRNLPDGRPA